MQTVENHVFIWETKGSHRRFYCGNNKLHGKCTPHSITDLEVNDYVLRVIRAHINVYVENVDLIRRLNQRQESIKNMMCLTGKSRNAGKNWKKWQYTGKDCLRIMCAVLLMQSSMKHFQSRMRKQKRDPE